MKPCVALRVISAAGWALLSFLELEPFVGKPVDESWPSCATSVIEPIALFGRYVTNV